jgi:hypothetical protein
MIPSYSEAGGPAASAAACTRIIERATFEPSVTEVRTVVRFVGGILCVVDTGA